MKKYFIFPCLFLVGCASALKSGEDNLAPIFEQIITKDFVNASQSLGLVKAYEKHSRRQLYYREAGEVYMVEERFLKHKISELNKAFKECDQLVSSLNSDDDYDYFSRNCLTKSSNSRSPLNVAINALKKYSEISLAPLFFDKNPSYLSERKKRYEEGLKGHQLALREREEKSAELARLKELSKDPRFKKCKLQSELIDSEKMLKMWQKNIKSLKANAKMAGTMTYKMEKNMNKSLSFVRTYKLKIQDTGQKLKKMSNVRVTTKSCTKMIPNYGISNADRYM